MVEEVDRAGLQVRTWSTGGNVFRNRMVAAIGVMVLLFGTSVAFAQGKSKESNGASVGTFTFDMCFMLPRIDAMGEYLLDPDGPDGYALSRGFKLASTAGYLYPKGTLSAWEGLDTNFFECPDISLSIGLVQNEAHAVPNPQGPGFPNFGHITVYLRFNGGPGSASYIGPLGPVIFKNAFGRISVISGRDDFADEGPVPLRRVGVNSTLHIQATLPLRPHAYKKSN
jgi:hypothetical protein